MTPMNHDYIDATFYAEWQGSPLRHKHSIYAFCPLRFVVSECLDAVVKQTPTIDLMARLSAGHGIVCLYENEADAKPFARAVLSLKMVPQFSLEKLST